MADKLQTVSKVCCRRQMELTGTQIVGTGNAIEPFRYNRFDHTVKDWRQAQVFKPRAFAWLCQTNLTSRHCYFLPSNREIRKGYQQKTDLKVVNS